MSDTELTSVLHVDDDPDIRVIMRLALETVGGLSVTQFGSGAATLAAADGLAPQLAVLDVMMPDMSGQSLWHELRRRDGFHDVPVVFVTAKAEDSFSEALVADGALAVISKPIDPITLADQLRGIWAERARPAG